MYTLYGDMKMSDRYDIMRRKQDVCRECKHAFTEINIEPCSSCKWFNPSDKTPSNFEQFKTVDD